MEQEPGIAHSKSHHLVKATLGKSPWSRIIELSDYDHYVLVVPRLRPHRPRCRALIRHLEPRQPFIDDFERYHRAGVRRARADCAARLKDGRHVTKPSTRQLSLGYRDTKASRRMRADSRWPCWSSSLSFPARYETTSGATRSVRPVIRSLLVHVTRHADAQPGLPKWQVVMLVTAVGGPRSRTQA